MSFLSKMTSEITALDKEFLIVTKLFTITKDFSVKIEPEDLALYQTLGPSFQGLKVSKLKFMVACQLRYCSLLVHCMGQKIIVVWEIQKFQRYALSAY